ncbi:MAG TPA: DUF4135 domain-containing protein, partial [Jatrophihabitantaceae bacterium]|nr:DUF4135 domain-containing protein [Jatrophihabitantaceae bacterium]
MSGDEAGAFGRVLDWAIDPALERLAGQLAGVSGLAADERAVVVDAAAIVLREVLSRKVTRMLVLELNAARLTGRLTALDAQGRWSEFLDLASDPAYWQELGTHYPRLLSRMDTLVANRCAALTALGTRFAADRAALAALAGADIGQLTGIRVGAGDSHRGGHTVTIVRCADATVVYKPRPVEVDHRLSTLLSELTSDDAAPIRVPEVLARDGYGWAEFVEHRHCADDAELR